MKFSVVLLAAAAVGCSASILSKSRTDKDDTARKLRLFVRAMDSKCEGDCPFNALPMPEVQPIPLETIATGGAQPGLEAPPQPSGDCHPKCSWTCGTAACDETCDPVCAPPQCETACEPLNLATCQQKCDPPKCAIVCPTSHCEHGGCPGCKTICAPAKCKTQCGTSCESKCAEPQCTWKCNPGKCEKPRCSLTCGGAQACGLGNPNAKPAPWTDDMTVLSKSLASADPKSLAKFATGTLKAPQMAPEAGEEKKKAKKIR